MVELVRGLDAARVRDSVARVREQIAAAGRDPADVELLAAVKYVPAEELATLVEAGVTLFGENRAQDLAQKVPAVAARSGVTAVTWDFIGHLQSRKVKQVLPLVRHIHSVSTDSVLRELGRHGSAETEVLVEVNVAGDEAKSGVRPEDLGDFLARVPARVVGLMTMPPLAERAEDSRRWFAALDALAAEHGLRHRSMGTSQDYAVAVQEGATIIRLGSALFR